MDGIRQPARSTALGVWTTLGLFTAVIASRRFAGAYTGPLTTGAMLVAVTLAATTALTALWLFRRDQPRTDSSPAAWLPELMAWGLPTLFSWVISPQATAGQLGTLLGIAAIGAIAIGVAVLETTPWWQARLLIKETAPPPQEAGLTEPATVSFEIEDGVVEDVPCRTEDERPLPDENTTQWMTRRQEPDGEAIEGTVRVDFAAGQRDATVHVTFCPPLPSVPEVELECVDGEDWQIRPEAVLPYGLRIQVRRSEGIAIEQSGLVAYLATASRRSQAA